MEPLSSLKFHLIKDPKELGADLQESHHSFVFKIKNGDRYLKYQKQFFVRPAAYNWMTSVDALVLVGKTREAFLAHMKVTTEETEEDEDEDEDSSSEEKPKRSRSRKRKGSRAAPAPKKGKKKHRPARTERWRKTTAGRRQLSISKNNPDLT